MFKDKIAVLNENKDLLMQERATLQGMMEQKIYEAVQIERDDANRNAQTVIESLRQASSDL